VKKNSKGKLIIFLFYVDDILTVGHDMSEIKSLKIEMSNSFTIMNLDHAK